MIILSPYMCKMQCVSLFLSDRRKEDNTENQTDIVCYKNSLFRINFIL